MNGADVIAEILKREGTELSLLLSAQSADRGLRRARHPHHPVPAGARRRRHRGRLFAHQSRQANGVFAAQAGPGIENAFPGIAQAFAENVPMLVDPGDAAARAALPEAGVPRRRRLSPGHQVVGDRALRAGAARPDAPRLPRHAQRQGRPGAGRSAARGLGGGIQGRARLHADADRARRARSGRGQAGGADAASGQEPDPVGRPGRALCGGRRPAGGACRAPSGAGRHHQSGQERDRRTAIRSRSAPRPARARRCTPTTWRRPIWCSPSARASPARRSDRACRPARRSFIRPTRRATSTRNTAPTSAWSATPASCSMR